MVLLKFKKFGQMEKLLSVNVSELGRFISHWAAHIALVMNSMIFPLGGADRVRADGGMSLITWSICPEKVSDHRSLCALETQSE